MSKKMSSEQSRSVVNGAGSLSHVYIQNPPLRCYLSGARGLYYDDGNKLLLSPTSTEVFSWKISGASSSHDVILTSDSIDEGSILSIRYSLDGRAIGILRSKYEIQFRNKESGVSFTQKCRSESESILGFFWTDCPVCNVVMIKTSGLDLFIYEPDLNSLRPVESKRLIVSWYVYTHESRMLLLASGMQCKTFVAFQFSSGGIIRLPKFEMTMTKAEENKKLVLAAEDLHIVVIYGRIYCLQVDRIAMQLRFYRFYRDAVVQQDSLPLYSTRIAVSVVDNVLLVHQVDAKVVILYDIFTDNHSPISAPLPLLKRFTKTHASSSRISCKQAVNSEVNEPSIQEGSIYDDGWTFLNPHFICDAAHGILWKLHLDLEAIAASSSGAPHVLEFLQRRKSEPNKAKQICLDIMKTMILERRPVSMISEAVHVLISSYAHLLKAGGLSQRVNSGVSSSNNAKSSQAKTVMKDFQSGVDHDLPLSIHGEVEGSSQDSNLEDINLQLKAVNLDETRENLKAKFLQNLRIDEAENSNVGEISDSVIPHSYMQSQMLEPSENLYNLNHPEQQEPQESQVPTTAISPDEMYNSVFALVEEEMSGDPNYLIAIIIEYLRSASLEKLKILPNLYVMLIHLLARNERYMELGLYIINKIIEPSREVAFQLLESGRLNSNIKNLGIDMLRQLSLHDAYVSALIQGGHYLEAVRYVQKKKIDTIQPTIFLEAISGSHNSLHLAAMLRYFCEYIPGFKNTPDYSTYHRILCEMCQSSVS